MIKLTRGHHISFKYAFEGVAYAFATQPNFRIHSYLAFFAIFLGVFFSITPTEWLVLTLTIFIVFITELINTAIEATSDLLVTTRNPVAKAAKDTSAAAVLFAAFCALAVGFQLFAIRLLNLFF